MDLAWYVQYQILISPGPRPEVPRLVHASSVSSDQTLHLSYQTLTYRTWDGLTLYSCSSDGTVAAFEFEEHELEGIVPHSVQGEYLKKFGFETRNAEIRLEQQRQREAFEKAQLLEQQQQQQQQQQSAPLTNGTTPYVPGQQQVTITKDGRRRIKPSLIGHLSSTGSSLLAPTPSIPAIPAGPMKISAPASASANVSTVDAFASAPLLPFSQGADADGDLDMSVPIDAWGPKGETTGTKVNLKARTLGGDKKREPAGPVRELRSAAGDGNAIIVGARVLDVPSVKSSLSCKVEGSEKDADSVEIRNSDNGELSCSLNKEIFGPHVSLQ
jgi:protein HIRA/HIR1